MGDFERLKVGSVISIVQSLMRLEGSSNSVLASFENLREDINWRDDIFTVSLATTTQEYETFACPEPKFNSQGEWVPASKPPWQGYSSRLGMCSDVGLWCIYGELFSEMSLLGVDRTSGFSLSADFVDEFGLERLSDALKISLRVETYGSYEAEAALAKFCAAMSSNYVASAQ